MTASTVTSTTAPISSGTSTVTSSGIPSGPITSQGVGSGINVASLVTSLVNAEGNPKTAQLTAQTTKLQANLSSWGLVQSGVSTLQTSLKSLTTASSFQPLAATSTNTAAFTVSTDGSAVAASYPITVNALAQPAIISSASFASATALVGPGSLAINLGSGKPFNITTSTITTLSGLRDAINSATDNPGIIATIIQVDTGSQLVLSSNVPGAANTINIASSANSSTSLAAFNTQPPTLSGTFAKASSLVGEGTLAISMGASAPLNITTTATTTLTGVRDLINNATGNPGVQATIVQGSSGAQLVLSSKVTGAVSALGVVATPTPSSLSPISSALNITAPTMTSLMSSIQPATDAVITVAGQTVTRQSNSFADVVPGVSFTLLAPTTTPATLSIASNSSAALTNIQAFISSYNALVSTVTSQTGYDAASKTTAPLSGNAALRVLQRQINQVLSNPVPGATKGYAALADIGITRDKTGALQLNTSKFTVAMTLNAAAVSSLFTSTNGMASSLNTVLTNSLSSGGVLPSTVKQLNSQVTAVAAKQAALNVMLSSLTARYTAQFTVMDNLMGKMTSTANFLTQTFNNTTKN